MHEKIEITTDQITLGQFLKLANIIESGGMAKAFLQEINVIVNGKTESRRGRKLYIHDIIQVQNAGSFLIEKADHKL